MPEVLFQERIEIFPRSVKGRYRSLKSGILLLAYAVYFLLPWLRWSREVGPEQAILFDIEGRRFYIFDLVVYAQDIFWLAGLLLIGAFLLFFVTGLAGRVFCGYFCFQTLWTDVFVFIERLVQGERNARIKLAQSDWSNEKIINHIHENKLDERFTHPVTMVGIYKVRTLFNKTGLTEQLAQRDVKTVPTPPARLPETLEEQ